MSIDKAMAERIILNMRGNLYHDQNPACDHLEQYIDSLLTSTTSARLAEEFATERAEKAEAELAALKGRRCDGCGNEDCLGIVIWDNPFSIADKRVSVDYCSEWTERQP